MSSFTYTALDPQGKTVKGRLDVGSRGEAYRFLEQRRLTPVQVRSGEDVESSASRSKAKGTVHLGQSPLILFTEELADLLDAGVQLQQALSIMAERQQHAGVKKVSARVRERLRDGATFSQALDEASPSFDDLYCNLVAAGEASGSLAKILKQLGASLTILHELQKRVIQAMIYPAFLIFACVGLIIVFMTVLMPQLTTLLASTNQQLPAATQALVDLSQGFVKHWWRIGLGIIGLIILWGSVLCVPSGRYWWDYLKMKCPLFGPVFATRYFATLSQGLANLVQNGVPLLSALKLMTRATTNRYYRQRLQMVTRRVEDGESFSAALKQSKGFPMLLVDLAAVGEQTGDLGRSLEKAAIRYDKELNGKITRLTSMITPVIIVIMAVLVTLVAYSIVSAIFKSVNGIRSSS